MLEKLGWDSLETRRWNARLTLLNRIVGGWVAMNTQGILGLPIRGQHKDTLHKQYKVRTDYSQDYPISTLILHTVREWNSTPDSFIVSLRDSTGETVAIRLSNWAAHKPPHVLYSDTVHHTYRTRQTKQDTIMGVEILDKTVCWYAHD